MAVFVGDKHHKPFMLSAEKRARLLVKARKASMHFMFSFTKEINRADGDSQLVNLTTHLTQQIKEQRLLLALKDLVSALTIR